MIRSVVKGTVIGFTGLVLLALTGTGTLIYLKTGDQYYSEENLAACKHYTVEQAKQTVLSAWLRQPNDWQNWHEAAEVARQKGIRFIDAEISGPAEQWLVPFYAERVTGRKQYGMLDCGKLTVEFASEWYTEQRDDSGH